MTISKTTLAYIGGLFDAEGSVFFNEDKRGVISPYVSIGNTDFRVIKFLDDLFPGNTVTMRYDNPKHKDLYTWRLSCRSIVKFLTDIYPYSRIKKEQIDLVLEFQRTKHAGRKHLTKDVMKRRLEIFDLVKELNRRGVVCAT